jgi:tetratricopeptide (TPR) repeat protein
VAYINLALSYVKLDEYDKAVSSLNNVIELSGTSNSNPAWAHLCLAYVQEKRENYDAARDEYQKAIYNLPDSAEVYAQYGMFLERQNELIGARAALNQMLLTAGDMGWAYGTLGDFLLRQGSTSEAITNYLNAIHYKPGDWLLHTMLAEAYSKNGNPDEAKIEFEKAISLPDVSYYSFAQYAAFLYRQGEYVAAEGLYRKALEIYAGDFAVYLNLGQTYQALNKTQEAIEVYRYIVSNADLFPDFAIELANQRLLVLEATP